jgi:hypothetical protein
MGKAIAVTVIFIIVCLIAYVAVTAIAQAIYRALWRRAKRQAKWEPYAEMTGAQEASVTVRRVAKLFGRREKLAEFDPVRITVNSLADPRLLEAYSKAEEQAQINNTVRLGEDV